MNPARFTRNGILSRTFVVACALLTLNGCANNINDVLAEMEYGDPETVKESVVEVGNLLRSKESAGYKFDGGDLEAVKYLEDLARKSPDQVVRACAVSTLSRLNSYEGTETYLAALQDESAAWIVRLEGAKALAARPDSLATDKLAERLKEEPRLEVRLSIVKALEKVEGGGGLKALLEVFLDGSRRYRNMRLSTYNAIVALSGESLAFEDGPGWDAYYKRRFGKETPK